MKRAAILIGLGLGLASCFEKSTPERDFMPDMFDSIGFKAQREDVNGPNGMSQRTPPEGTVPRNFKPYPYAQDQGAIAGKELRNPLAHTKANLERGQKMFNIYCIVCHGPKGHGDGLVVPPFPRPPDLTSEKIAGWGDGQIFHTITMGQNTMPSYATQIQAADRWAITLYVRALHRASNPSATDIQEWESLTK